MIDPLNFDWATAIVLADRLRNIILKGKPMLKIILSLLAFLPIMERDIESTVSEMKEHPDGVSRLKAMTSALRKLANNIDAMLL